MSSSAAGGGPGKGPFGSFKSSQMPVKQPMIVISVVASAALVYAFWELRLRASRKLGQIPRTVDREWQEAEHERMRHAPFEANPHKFAYLNPFRHNVPMSKAVITE